MSPQLFGRSAVSPGFDHLKSGSSGYLPSVDLSRGVGRFGDTMASSFGL
jgi:hypothetical protein